MHADTYYRLFYLLKVIRIDKGNDLFDVSDIMANINTYYRSTMQEKIETDHILAEDVLNDNNNIEFLMKLSYFFKTLKLVCVILTISYFVGILWLIICQLNIEYFKAIDGYDSHTFFIDEYDLNNQGEDHVIISLVYYSFTSLSTVGFGDFHPKSDPERLFCAFFMLLMGVAVFTIVMGNFAEILEKFTMLNADLDDDEKLS